MKFDLERFFMRNNSGIQSGGETRYVKVPKSIVERVTAVNNQFRKNVSE